MKNLENHQTLVVVAKGGNPDGMTQKEYADKYLQFEAEVFEKFPDRNLATVRESLKSSDSEMIHDSEGVLGQTLTGEHVPVEGTGGRIE